MDCPSVRTLADAVAAGAFAPEVERHLGDCRACSGVVSSLREETEGLSFSVGQLWMQERISCPHPDILLAHASGGLDPEEAEFIDFHLHTVECPGCQSRAEQISDALKDLPPARLEAALEESKRRTRSFFGR